MGHIIIDDPYDNRYTNEHTVQGDLRRYYDNLLASRDSADSLNPQNGEQHNMTDSLPNLSEVLEAAGYTRTVFVPRPGGNAKKSVGSFDPRSPVGPNDDHTLINRYGVTLADTQGGFSIEGKPDPSVLDLWVSARGPHGGVAFFDNLVRSGVLSRVIAFRPSTMDQSQDIMVVSNNGQTTFYNDVFLPWLKASNGGQNPDEGSGGTVTGSGNVVILETGGKRFKVTISEV